MNREGKTKLLYQLDGLPIFQNRMYDTAAEAKTCPTGNMQLVEDLQTGLIYNAAFRPELMAYDNNYQNEQGVSVFFQKHLESVSRIIERCMGRDSIVEIGCGKGFFLEMLLRKGFNIAGFDPAYEGTNPRIVKQYFEPEIGVRANGLVLRHVLEHIQNPFSFLLRLKAANGGGGKIYIEVPCFDWICERRVWFDIFYEHVNYFRISDFFRLFGAVIESGLLFGGQYLYVVADLATLRQPKIDVTDRVTFPENFLHLPSGLDRTEQNRTAIWGGASKGTIFALYTERIGKAISFVIDINPAKQGKYLALTGLLVQSPSEVLAILPKDSTIFVMNSNYLEEIKHMSNNLFHYIEFDHE